MVVSVDNLASLISSSCWWFWRKLFDEWCIKFARSVISEIFEKDIVYNHQQHMLHLLVYSSKMVW